MPNLHPLVVHIPIALLTFSALFDLLALLARRQEFERTGWWTLLAGFIGLAATITTGLLAETTVTIADAAVEFFETHEQLAFAVAALYCLLLLWRIANRSFLPKRRPWLFVGLSLLGMLLVWATGWFGGEMVFRFGVGVRP